MSVSPPSSSSQQSSPFVDTLARLTSRQHIEQFLPAALHETIQATQCEAGSLLLVGDYTRRAREGSLSLEIENLISLWEENLEERLRSTLWQIKDGDSLPVSTHTLDAGQHLLVNAPLLHGENVVGSITLLFSPGTTLSMSQRQLLISCARTIGNLATIIEQLTLTQHSLEQLTFLHETSQALISTLDLRQVLDNTMQLATEILDAQASTLMLIDERTGQLVFDIPYGEKRELLRSYRMNVDQGIAGWVAKHGEPAIVNDTAKDERFSRDTDVRTGFLTQSVICVPLQIKERTIGVLEALNKISSDHFTDDDLRLLSTLAAQAAIAIENARLYRSLSEERDKIIRVQEEARRNLARDLHDSTLQSLSSISMRIDYVKQLLEHEPSSVPPELDRLQAMVHQASKEARILLFELRPIALETQGLARGLETYIEQLQGDSSPTFHFDDGGFHERLESDVEAAAFIVVQEAMNNARKHSDARNIWLNLKPDGDRLLITVTDDGTGFDFQDARNNCNRGGHLGLVSMQERAQQIEAALDILTEPGRGTKVILGVPRTQPQSES